MMFDRSVSILELLPCDEVEKRLYLLNDKEMHRPLIQRLLSFGYNQPC
jgi:hypothetical protein